MRENRHPPETQSGSQSRPQAIERSTGQRMHHENGAQTSPAPSNPGPDALPNRMPNNESGPDNNGAGGRHTRQIHERTSPPPEHAAPMNRPEEMPLRHPAEGAMRHESTTPMGGPPPVRPAPMRGNVEHAPPPNSGKGEDHGNGGHEKRGNKPEEPPPPPQ